MPLSSPPPGRGENLALIPTPPESPDLDLLDLRKRKRAQNQIADVADDRFIREPRVRRQLLPVGIVAERRPMLVQFGKVAKAQHVSEARHACADQRVAKEHVV